MSGALCHCVPSLGLLLLFICTLACPSTLSRAARTPNSMQCQDVIVHASLSCIDQQFISSTASSSLKRSLQSIWQEAGDWIGRACRHVCPDSSNTERAGPATRPRLQQLCAEPRNYRSKHACAALRPATHRCILAYSLIDR